MVYTGIQRLIFEFFVIQILCRPLHLDVVSQLDDVHDQDEDAEDEGGNGREPEPFGVHQESGNGRPEKRAQVECGGPHA